MYDIIRLWGCMVAMGEAVERNSHSWDESEWAAEKVAKDFGFGVEQGRTIVEWVPLWVHYGYGNGLLNEDRAESHWTVEAAKERERIRRANQPRDETFEAMMRRYHPETAMAAIMTRSNLIVRMLSGIGGARNERGAAGDEETKGEHGEGSKLAGV